MEGGLRLTVSEQLDVEGEYQNFIRKMKSGGQSRRIAWFSVAATVVILISASWWLLENSLPSKKQDAGGRTHCTWKESSRIDYRIRRGIRVKCIPR